MLNECLHYIMRWRAIILSALIIFSTISVATAKETVTTQDMDISGNYTLTSNLTIGQGTKLTLKPGAVIDTQNYSLKIDGMLIADNATIMSSVQTSSPGSHNAGVWDSLTISHIGAAILDNITISNAKSCIINNGNLTAKSLILEHCLIGLENAGQSNITGLTISHVDSDGIRVSGNAILQNLDLHDMSAGISSSGSLSVFGANFSSTGTGITLHGGFADVQTLNFTSGIGNAVSISSGASGSINGMVGTSNNAIVSLDSTGFDISNIDMTGQRLVNSWSAGDITIRNADFYSNSPETPIDIRTSGKVILDSISLTGAFSTSQVSHEAPWIGTSFSGSGDFILNNTSIDATDTALAASGTGTLEITNSTLVSERLGISFSGISSTSLNQVNVNIASGGEKGLDILQGSHEFDDLIVNMPFNRYESGSIGIESWWCDIDGGNISVNGFAEGIEIHESHLVTEDLNLLDSSQHNIYASSSQIQIMDQLETRIADKGIVLISSHANIRTWSASYHENAAEIDSDSRLNVWSVTALSNTEPDIIGDGVVNYGTNQDLDITTTEQNRLWEMGVTFEDLSGNTVDANWEVLGFDGKASAGFALLPISEAGSTIIATYTGVGTISEVIGADGGSHTIQVPIMPQGDWVLTPGTVVVLGPTEDGSPHIAKGNITIPTNAGLILQDTELVVPYYSKVTVDEYGNFEGLDATLHSDIISKSGDFGNSQNSNLSVVGNVTWTSCQNDIFLNNIKISGNVILDNSCRVTINSGEVSQTVTAGNGAVFEIVNTLEILVTDKGEPIEGAMISVQGQSVMTDSSGSAKKTTVALRVDSSGQTLSGLQQVTMQWEGITDLLGWDTTSSLTHEFIVSTVQGGVLSEWLILEKAWSPYHLTSDLVIPSGQTLTINDGVSLRISDSVTITVEGDFVSGSSTISSMGGGARWGGLIIGDNVETSVRIVGTNMFEGSPLLTINDHAAVVIGDSLFSRSSGAESLLRITNTAAGSVDVFTSSFTDSSSHCIEAQGSATLSLANVVLENCYANSLWARASELQIDGLVANQPIDIEGSTGYMHNFNGTSLNVNNLDNFEFAGIVVDSITGTNNRDLVISDANIFGAPGMYFEDTAGYLSGLTVDCGGQGVGVVANQGRATISLKIQDSKISNCTTGIEIQADGETAPLILSNVEIQSVVSISSDNYDVILTGGNLNGSLDVKSSVFDLYDIDPISYSIYQGEIRVWSTHVFEIRQNGNLVSAELQISVDSYWSKSYQGDRIQASLPSIIYFENQSQTYSNVQISASSVGNPTKTEYHPFGLDVNEIINITLIGNQAPEVSIIIPDNNIEIMETLPIEIRAVISDDLNQLEDLAINWYVIFEQTEVMQLSGDWNNITDLPAGIYLLNLEVIDEQGLSSSDAILFEVTLLDSDQDWGLTCNGETWYDKEQNQYCGPDVYDADDDNDGVLDTRDPWPADPCASMDTDSDGQPDRLHCPLGKTTWLNEDQDDDGDGTPDVLEGSENDDETEDNPYLVALFILVFFAAVAILLARRNKGVD